jgi:hypothetical protein
MSTEHPNQPEAVEPQKQVSERQLAANRANAQKSTGPRTDAGRLRSSANSITHGLTARVVCLPGEVAERYNARLQAYTELIQPRNIAESDIAHNLVAALSRKERAVKYERVPLVEKQAVNRKDIDRRFRAIGVEAETALAFKVLSDESNVLRQLDRYETRLHREIESYWRQLDHLRKLCPPSSNSPDMPVRFGETTFRNEKNLFPKTNTGPPRRPNPSATLSIPWDWFSEKPRNPHKTQNIRSRRIPN